MLYVTSILVIITRLLPHTTSFPYTTLFRSHAGHRRQRRSPWQEEPHPLPLIRRGRPQPRARRQLDGVRSAGHRPVRGHLVRDRKSTRLNSSHQIISYAVFCLKKKKQPS